MSIKNISDFLFENGFEWDQRSNDHCRVCPNFVLDSKTKESPKVFCHQFREMGGCKVYCDGFRDDLFVKFEIYCDTDKLFFKNYYQVIEVLRNAWNNQQMM